MGSWVFRHMMRRLFMTGPRLATPLLLAAGVVLVFAGLTSALGFSVWGLTASAAAVAALLYAGGVWAGGAPHADPSFVLFTRGLTIAAGPLAGRPVAGLFPDTHRGEIEGRCRQALEGFGSRFTCGSGAGARTFEAAPIRTAEGAVVYGVLLSGALVTRAAQALVTPSA
jgi:hypothetical protein